MDISAVADLVRNSHGTATGDILWQELKRDLAADEMQTIHKVRRLAVVQGVDLVFQLRSRLSYCPDFLQTPCSVTTRNPNITNLQAVSPSPGAADGRANGDGAKDDPLHRRAQRSRCDWLCEAGAAVISSF